MKTIKVSKKCRWSLNGGLGPVRGFEVHEICEVDDVTADRMVECGFAESEVEADHENEEAIELSEKENISDTEMENKLADPKMENKLAESAPENKTVKGKVGRPKKNK